MEVLVRKADVFLAALLFARAVVGQESPGPPSPAPPVQLEHGAATGALKVIYQDGQLTISGLHSGLAEVLTKVAAITGVKIDIPDGAAAERMPILELGPGPAREVLASLLSETNFDYLIQADGNSGKLQSVLVVAREKGPAINERDVPRATYARTVAPPPPAPEPPSVTDNPAPAQQAAQPADASAPAAQPSPAPPDPSIPAPSTLVSQEQQPGMLNGLRIAPVPVPSSMDQQSINQQLQQMYQQRVQLQSQQPASQQTMPPVRQ
jgi:hypothetical protein